MTLGGMRVVSPGIVPHHIGDRGKRRIPADSILVSLMISEWSGDMLVSTYRNE